MKYFCRTTLSSLWEQYYKFGFWKVAVISKCRTIPAVRHIVPALFLVSVLLLTLGGLYSSIFLLPLLAVLATYGALILFGSWLGSRQKPIKWFATAAPAFLVLHTAYGLGFLHGLVSCLVTREAETRGAKPSTKSP